MAAVSGDGAARVRGGHGRRSVLFRTITLLDVCTLQPPTLNSTPTISPPTPLHPGQEATMAAYLLSHSLVVTNVLPTFMVAVAGDSATRVRGGQGR